jgi:hypothetical protein
MEKKIIILGIAAIVILAIAGCKKSSSSEVTQPIKADTVFTVITPNAFPAYDGWNSIAFDASGNKIFFYYANTTDGFKIDMFDIATGTTSTIYKHFSQSGQAVWVTSNGSEGMRLRYFSNTYDGNKLIVPGGATNHFIVEIKVNSDYSTSFEAIDNIPANSNGLSVIDAYDADLAKGVSGNQISVVSMYNSVYNINTLYPAYAVSPTSHGSSIIGTPGGMEYVFCGTNQTLELYNNGAFIRAATLLSGGSQLQMDSKKRIYAYNGSIIYRFSSDLLKVERFPVKGTVEGYRQEAMVIQEKPNWVQVYSFRGKDLIGMKLPL